VKPASTNSIHFGQDISYYDSRTEVDVQPDVTAKNGSYSGSSTPA
jgi:hypothetical protein